MNIALCFCVKNCEPYLFSMFLNIELLKVSNINNKIYSIFVYDNCTDNSENILKDYQSKNPENVIIRQIDNPSPHRTVRIAKARNEIVNIIYNELYDIQYHIVIDCDDVCCTQWNTDVINNYLNNFDNDDWDSISFNRDEYYDIWALMYDDFRFQCYGFGDKSWDVVLFLRKAFQHKLDTSTQNSIQVYSGFDGFAIYKTAKFKGIKYDGLYENYIKLITPIDIYKTLIFLRKNNFNVRIQETVECCEHLFYHLCAIKKGCKIKVSKFKITDLKNIGSVNYP